MWVHLLHSRDTLLNDIIAMKRLQQQAKLDYAVAQKLCFFMQVKEQDTLSENVKNVRNQPGLSFCLCL